MGRNDLTNDQKRSICLSEEIEEKEEITEDNKISFKNDESHYL